MGASPLIRIRLGNLLRSNYSKFALARLFGAELEGITRFNQKSEEGETKIRSNGAPVESVDSRIEKEKSKQGTEWIVAGGTTVVLHAALDKSQPPKGAKKIKNKFNLHCQTVVKFSTTSPGSRAVVEFVKPQGKIDPKDPHFGNSRSDEYLLRNKFTVEFSKLMPTDSLKKRIQNEYENDNLTAGNASQIKIDKYYKEQTERLGALAEFMSEEKNALVKSFKSSSGKGLAGFIETMSFDWYSNVTWDVDLAKKAPKLCKVTIAFSPMHDISPGLDSNGYNRAPIYPKDSKQPGGIRLDENPGARDLPASTTGEAADVELA